MHDVVPESRELDPEVERSLEQGTINGYEAERGIIDVGYSLIGQAEQEKRPRRVRINPDRELSRLIGKGLIDSAVEETLPSEASDAASATPSPRRNRTQHRKTRIRTPADARAADRLSEDQWNLR